MYITPLRQCSRARKNNLNILFLNYFIKQDDELSYIIIEIIRFKHLQRRSDESEIDTTRENIHHTDIEKPSEIPINLNNTPQNDN